MFARFADFLKRKIKVLSLPPPPHHLLILPLFPVTTVRSMCAFALFLLSIPPGRKAGFSAHVLRLSLSLRRSDVCLPNFFTRCRRRPNYTVSRRNKREQTKRGERTKSFADQQELNELPFSLPIPIRNGGMCIVCGQQRRKPYKRRIEGGLLLFTQEESESLPLSVRSIPFTRLLLPMFPDQKGELRRSKVLPSSSHVMFSPPSLLNMSTSSVFPYYFLLIKRERPFVLPEAAGTNRTRRAEGAMYHGILDEDFSSPFVRLPRKFSSRD